MGIKPRPPGHQLENWATEAGPFSARFRLKRNTVKAQTMVVTLSDFEVMDLLCAWQPGCHTGNDFVVPEILTPDMLGNQQGEKISTTVNSRYLEFQGTLWNTSKYPYLDISDF